jgi:hypothetical protein
MVVFLLVAKGWSITRENFSANEWRGVIMSMSVFYMANSIVLVLESNVISRSGYWIASAVLYGLIYLYILGELILNKPFTNSSSPSYRYILLLYLLTDTTDITSSLHLVSVWRELVKISNYVKLLQPDMPAVITTPLKMKKLMYIIFLLLVLLSMTLEVIIHALVSTYQHVWVGLCLYEISNMLIFLVMGWIFRPTEYSPFFFMIPAQMLDNRHRYAF